MRKRVVITGLGCISPVGNNVKDTWDAIIAGKSGAGPITHFDASNHKTRFACEVKGFDGAALLGGKEVRRMDRFTQFAVAATLEAVGDANLTINDGNRERIGVLIGTGIGGIGTIMEQTRIYLEKGPDRISPFLVPMMIADNAAGAVAIRLSVRGPNGAYVTACATGSNAVGEGAEVIRRGSADVMLVGGSEASIVGIAMAGLNVMTALSTYDGDPTKASRPFDKNRDGFVMGEGAGIMVLESLEHAQARGAKILAEVTGYGNTDDAYHLSAPAENGSGAAMCMKVALEDAGLTPQDIGYINAHGTSTALNDKSETAAIKTTFGEHAYNIPISSTKSMTGHVLGASGAIEAVLCVKVLEHDLLPATINYETPDPECDLDYVPNTPRKARPNHIMSNSFGFGGHNASVIISRFMD